MKLVLNNELQHKIADLLWDASDQEAVDTILNLWGKDAQVVYHMMVAEAIDLVDETDLAAQIIRNL